jgi:hypothetical protein
MFELHHLILAFLAGAVAMFATIWLVANGKALKSRVENPLTLDQKRVIKDFAQRTTGRDFLWTRDGHLTLWK